jgi:hypothetical protein
LDEWIACGVSGCLRFEMNIFLLKKQAIFFDSKKETQAGYRSAPWVFNIPESAKKLRQSRRR